MQEKCMFLLTLLQVIRLTVVTNAARRQRLVTIIIIQA